MVQNDVKPEAETPCESRLHVQERRHVHGRRSSRFPGGKIWDFYWHRKQLQCNWKFRDFNLPEFLRGTSKNDKKIVELEGIGPIPNDENKRTVLSLSQPTVHTVQIKSKGNKFTCDNHCPRFKECTMSCMRHSLSQGEWVIKEHEVKQYGVSVVYETWYQKCQIELTPKRKPPSFDNESD